MSESGGGDLDRALHKLKRVGLKKENLPDRVDDALWMQLMSNPFNLNWNELFALKKHILSPESTTPVTPTSPPNTTHSVELNFSFSPSGDLKDCLNAVADVDLRTAILGPGPCLFADIPRAFRCARSGRMVNPTVAMVDTVLLALRTFVRSLNPATKPKISDEHLMAIRLYTSEEPIPFYKFVNAPLNTPDRAQRIGNVAPFIRLLIKALQAMGRAGYYVETAAYRGLHVTDNPLLQEKYDGFPATFPVGDLLTLAAFTSVSLDGTAPDQFGDALFFSMRSVRGVDISCLSVYPTEREILLIPPVVFKIDNAMKVHGLLCVSLSQVEQRGAHYLSGSSCTATSNPSVGVSTSNTNASVASTNYTSASVGASTSNASVGVSKSNTSVGASTSNASVGASTSNRSVDASTSNRSVGASTSYASPLDAEAQYLLAERLRSGRGVTQDLKAAVKWYRLAADQGHKSAQYDLGECYWNGEGVNKNDKEAKRWYRLAKSNGHDMAQRRLQEMQQCTIQ